MTVSCWSLEFQEIKIVDNHMGIYRNKGDIVSALLCKPQFIRCRQSLKTERNAYVFQHRAVLKLLPIYTS